MLTFRPTSANGNGLGEIVREKQLDDFRLSTLRGQLAIAFAPRGKNGRRDWRWRRHIDLGRPEPG